MSTDITKIRVPVDALNYLATVIRQQILQQENLLFQSGLKQKWKQKKYEDRITQLKIIHASVLEELSVVYELEELRKLVEVENRP